MVLEDFACRYDDRLATHGECYEILRMSTGKRPEGVRKDRVRKEADLPEGAVMQVVGDGPQPGDKV